MPATDDYMRDPKKMHRVFALTSVIMFVAFLLMMKADHTDEWREYQKTSFRIQSAMLAQEITGSTSESYTQELSALEQLRDQAQADLDESKGELSELQAQVREATREFDLIGRKVKEERGKRDEKRANYDLAVRDDLAESRKEFLLEEFNAKQSEVEELELQLEEANTALNELTAQLKAKTQYRDKAAERLANAQKAVDQKQAALEQIAPETGSGLMAIINRVKRATMELPIIDGFNSPLKIQQDWVPGLQQKLGMTESARFDRCVTCHQGIDKVAAGNVPIYPHGDGIESHKGAASDEDIAEWIAKNEFPHPYSTHPNPDLFLTASSPHPREKFGCTICHEGQGSGTSFQNAAHGPNDPVQEHEWAHKYGYFDNHFWEYGMLPERFQESHCIKCHHNVTELGVHPKFGASAPKVVRGYELVSTYGCFGCHEIQGFKGIEPIGPDLRLEPQTAEEAARIAADPNQIAGTMRKVGPSLRYLASKTTRGWIENWTANPAEFRPSTRMPRFFGLTNQQDAHAREFQPVEIAAITQFLLSKSQPFEYLEPQAGYEPDAERGKQLFSEKGCLACHSHSAFPNIQKDFGPNLDKMHAKLPAGADGFKWLYSWIKEPTRYHARTRMPDLILDPYTEGETTIDPVADIAAWLLEGGPQEWSTIDVDDAALDKLVALFLSRKVLTEDQFKQFMETRDITQGGKLSRDDLKGDEVEFWTEDPSELSDEEWKALKLNYVGRRTVSRYGCYGCHDIPDFETARPIGVALQDWGRKDRSKLAPEHIEEFLKEPVTKFLAIPLAEDEDAAALLEDVTTPVQFKELAESRGESDDAALQPFEVDARHGDFNEELGDVHELQSLDVGQWTPEPVELAGADGETRRFLVLAEERHSMEETVADYLKSAEGDAFTSEEAREQAMTTAYFYQSLLHHGRPGFLWQKLRQPRSYDFAKTETKGYDERLRMPRFPFDQDDIEAIATFVLGLVAEPPSEEYLYRPSGPAGDRIAGEKLLKKYNCVGCHQLDMQTFDYTIALDELPTAAAGEPVDSSEAMRLLEALKPPRKISVPGHAQEVRMNPGVQVVLGADPDEDPEDRFYATDLWEHLLIERQEVSGRIVHLHDGSDAGSHLVDLAPDGSVKAALALEDGQLSVQVVEEDGESALEAERAFIELDLLGGKQTFELELDGDPEDGTFVLAAEKLPAELTDIEKVYGTVRVKFADVRLTPSSRLVIPEPAIHGTTPQRGGEFTEWLVQELKDGAAKGDIAKARQMAAPPLYREGVKVQTPWLYRFLMNPQQIRFTTVLRMPKFNMSPEEAQTLANYFAAVDEAAYPYQQIPQQEPPYLSQKNREFHEQFGGEGDYLGEAWKVFNAPLCIKCHALGGREYQKAPGNDPNADIRGPNLRTVEERLRPDWTLLWVYYPKWFTPYTSMPQNFPLEKQQFPELFGGDAAVQTQAIRDALMNHAQILEREGVVIWEPPKTEGEPAANNGGNE